MNPVTGTLILTAVAIVFIALWAWVALYFRPKRPERIEPEPAEVIDFSEALRCRGGRLTPPPPPSDTPLLDAYRERR